MEASPSPLDGWHTKSGRGPFARSTRRYFRLHDGILSWYVSPSSAAAQNSLKLSECRVSAADGNKLKLQAPEKLYTLLVDDAATCNRWLAALLAHSRVVSSAPLPQKVGGTGGTPLKLQKAVLSRAATSAIGKRYLLSRSAEGTVELIQAVKRLVTLLAPSLGVTGEREASRLADQMENAILSVAVKVVLLYKHRRIAMADLGPLFGRVDAVCYQLALLHDTLSQGKDIETSWEDQKLKHWLTRVAGGVSAVDAELSLLIGSHLSSKSNGDFLAACRPLLLLLGDSARLRDLLLSERYRSAIAKLASSMNRLYANYQPDDEVDETTQKNRVAEDLGALRAEEGAQAALTIADESEESGEEGDDEDVEDRPPPFLVRRGVAMLRVGDEPATEVLLELCTDSIGWHSEASAIAEEVFLDSDSIIIVKNPPPARTELEVHTDGHQLALLLRHGPQLEREVARRELSAWEAALKGTIRAVLPPDEVMEELYPVFEEIEAQKRAEAQAEGIPHATRGESVAQTCERCLLYMREASPSLTPPAAYARLSGAEQAQFIAAAAAAAGGGVEAALCILRFVRAELPPDSRTAERASAHPHLLAAFAHALLHLHAASGDDLPADGFRRAQVYRLAVERGVQALCREAGGGLADAAVAAMLQRLALAADAHGLHELSLADAAAAAADGEGWAELCAALRQGPPLLAAVGSRGAASTFRFVDASIRSYFHALAICTAPPAPPLPLTDVDDAWRSTLFFGVDLGTPFQEGLVRAFGLGGERVLRLDGREAPPLLLFHLVNGMDSLRELHLTRCGLSASCLQLLLVRTTLLTTQTVTALVVDDNPIGDGAATALHDWLSGATPLEKLSMRSTRSSGATAQAIGDALALNRSLHTLLLDGNPLSDGDVYALRAAKQQADLRRGFVLEVSASGLTTNDTRVPPSQPWLDIPAELWW
ncbi:hypothetical protein AB1Y20_007516 [Prymnesium parvum]|uniref:PH domain-containing protein n=1 Tax=Prymnesium parvum TaxID=97485 RepID=A0AB34IV38_PRYPA